MDAVEEARLARQRGEGNDAVLVRLDHPLDYVGEQAPHVLHAFLLGGLALHLRPEDLRWPFAEGLLDDRAGTVGDAVELVDLVVQFAVEMPEFDPLLSASCLASAEGAPHIGQSASNHESWSSHGRLKSVRDLIAAVPGLPWHSSGCLARASVPIALMLVRVGCGTGRRLTTRHLPEPNRHISALERGEGHAVHESQQKKLLLGVNRGDSAVTPCPKMPGAGIMRGH